MTFLFVIRVQKRTSEKPLILLGFPRFSLRIYYNIKKHSLQQKMQKVPINYITAMQSKRLQNCNRYKMIYSIHIAPSSPADAQFTLKLRCKRKALLQHQSPESNRLLPAHGNKTFLFTTDSHSSPLSWPL